MMMFIRASGLTLAVGLMDNIKFGHGTFIAPRTLVGPGPARLDDGAAAGAEP